MSFYTRALNQVLIPAYYNLRGRHYSRCLKLMERMQWRTPDEVRAYQWNELQKLVAHACNTVPYYRRKYQAAGIAPGDIRSYDDFRRLPPLTREEINEFRSELCTTAPVGKLIEHATGGSSGTPTRFFMTRESYDWRCAATTRAYAWSGYRPGDPALYLWGAPAKPLGRLREWKLDLYHRLRAEHIVNSFRQTDDVWRHALAMAETHRPRFIVGYASSLDQFCRFLKANGRRLTGIEACISAAEPLEPTLPDLVAETMGARTFNTYGSREFMSIAVQCPENSGLHINAENILLEQEEPGAGASDLLVTDLHNFGLPFLRYRIGDVGSVGEWKTCNCGRGLPTLNVVEGRKVDLLRAQDGRRVSGLVFPHIIKEVPEVQHYQIEQLTADRFVLRVVLTAELKNDSRQYLQSNFRDLLGEGSTVTIEPVAAIPLRPSGKRRVVIGLN